MKAKQIWVIDDFFIRTEAQGEQILSAFKSHPDIEGTVLMRLDRSRSYAECVARNPELQQALTAADIVGVIGSIAFVQWVTRTSNVTHAQYHSFLASTFCEYSAFIQHVPSSMRLNTGGFLLPLYSLIDSQPEIKRNFGERVFIRPDQSLKVAEAEVVKTDIHSLSLMTEALQKYSGASRKTLFWLFPEKTILAEWRCWVFRGVIQGMSKYAGDIDCDDAMSSQVLTFANEAAKAICGSGSSSDTSHFQQEPFVMDVGLSGNEMKVIELNSASTSGWYQLPVKPCVSSCVDSLHAIHAEMSVV